MIIAVDTNIFLDVLRPNPQFVDTSLALLKRSADEGALVVCDIVWSEVAVNFTKREDLEAFFAAVPVTLDPFEAGSLYAASRAWRTYRKAGGKRERILPDFLIGAHAARQAAKLLTRDRGFYRSYFPTLKIVER